MSVDCTSWRDWSKLKGASCLVLPKYFVFFVLFFAFLAISNHLKNSFSLHVYLMLGNFWFAPLFRQVFLNKPAIIYNVRN